MKFQKIKWSKAKILTLGIMFLASLLNFDPMEKEKLPPILLAFIPLLFFPIFLPIYLRLTYENIKEPVGDDSIRNPLSPFRDPLPFYHFASLASLVFTLGSIPRWIMNNQIGFEGVFSLSAGLGGLLGIMIYKKRRKAEPDGAGQPM